MSETTTWMGQRDEAHVRHEITRVHGTLEGVLTADGRLVGWPTMIGAATQADANLAAAYRALVREAAKDLIGVSLDAVAASDSETGREYWTVGGRVRVRGIDQYVSLSGDRVFGTREQALGFAQAAGLSGAPILRANGLPSGATL